MKLKPLAIALVCAILAFLLGASAPLGKYVWPVHPGLELPSAGQIPFFVLLSALEALAFGIGVAFLVNGWPWINQVTGRHKLRAVAMYLSTAWLLINWFPHDNLHMHNGSNLSGLLYIEYGFHVTLIVAGLALAVSFATILREGALTTATSDAAGNRPARLAE